VGWWPFKERTYLEQDDEAWVIETWRWFLDQLGGTRDLSRSRLVLPTREFFPPTESQGPERAEHIFACVKRLARMPDWPCKLIAQPPSPELRVGEQVALKAITHMPAGTFAFDGNEVTISYNPRDVDDPGQLIATLAHELAHYLLHGLKGEIPGGEEMHEPATDLLTVYMGFGVFGAMAAFNYSQNFEGWQWSRQGYLNERTWIFALAIFLSLRDEAPDAVKPYLKRHLFSDLGAATRYLRQRQTLARLV
jgi:hypothetical protein